MTNRTAGRIPDDLETLSCKVDGGVGFIKMDRPEKKNALNTRLFQELCIALDAWRYDDDVACVVIHGTEEYFSAGLDLDVLNRPSDEDRLEWYDATYDGYLALLEYVKPIIAAVAGPTFGGGCDIAAFCDMRVSVPNAKFGFPQVRFGLTPFVHPLWQIVGLSQAKLLTLTGRRIDAEEAFRIGLIDVMAEEGKLLDTATEIARQIASTGTDTVVRATEMLRRSPNMDDVAAYVYAHVQYRDSHWMPEVNDRIEAYRTGMKQAKS